MREVGKYKKEWGVKRGRERGKEDKRKRNYKKGGGGNILDRYHVKTG
jgi:hypothetical protein